MDRDLFLAILAMDAYNRGYGTGIKDLPESGSLGTAEYGTFVRHPNRITVYLEGKRHFYLDFCSNETESIVISDLAHKPQAYSVTSHPLPEGF